MNAPPREGNPFFVKDCFQAGLWVFAALLWIILIYTSFAAVAVAEPKPSIAVAINGSWLLG